MRALPAPGVWVLRFKWGPGAASPWRVLVGLVVTAVTFVVAFICPRRGFYLPPGGSYLPSGAFVAIILTIAIVATTMVMMVMVVLPIDRSMDDSTKIDRSVGEPSNEDRSINRYHVPPPTSLSPAGRSYRYIRYMMFDIGG